MSNSKQITSFSSIKITAGDLQDFFMDQSPRKRPAKDKIYRHITQYTESTKLFHSILRYSKMDRDGWDFSFSETWMKTKWKESPIGLKRHVWLEALSCVKFDYYVASHSGFFKDCVYIIGNRWNLVTRDMARIVHKWPLDYYCPERRKIITMDLRISLPRNFRRIVDLEEVHKTPEIECNDPNRIPWDDLVLTGHMHNGKDEALSDESSSSSIPASDVPKKDYFPMASFWNNLCSKYTGLKDSISQCKSDTEKFFSLVRFLESNKEKISKIEATYTGVCDKLAGVGVKLSVFTKSVLDIFSIIWSKLNNTFCITNMIMAVIGLVLFFLYGQVDETGKAVVAAAAQTLFFMGLGYNWTRGIIYAADKFVGHSLGDVLYDLFTFIGEKLELPMKAFNKCVEFHTFVRNAIASLTLIEKLSKFCKAFLGLFERLYKMAYTWWYGYPPDVTEEFMQNTISTWKSMKSNPTRYIPAAFMAVEKQVLKILAFNLQKQGVVFDFFNNILTDIHSFQSKYCADVLTARKGVVPPLVICFYGPAGKGKSTFVQSFGKALSKALLRTDYPSVHTRNSTLKYWDGYEGEMVCVYDDFGQIVDTESTPSPDFIDLIRMKNVAPFALEMSETCDKGNYIFSSAIVILSMNKIPTPSMVKSLVHFPAIDRRLEVRIEFESENEMWIRRSFGTDYPKDESSLINADKILPHTLDVFRDYYAREYDICKQLDERLTKSIPDKLYDNWHHRDALRDWLYLNMRRDHLTEAQANHLLQFNAVFAPLQEDKTCDIKDIPVNDSVATALRKLVKVVDVTKVKESLSPLFGPLQNACINMRRYLYPSAIFSRIPPSPKEIITVEHSCPCCSATGNDFIDENISPLEVMDENPFTVARYMKEEDIPIITPCPLLIYAQERYVVIDAQGAREDILVSQLLAWYDTKSKNFRIPWYVSRSMIKLMGAALMKYMSISAESNPPDDEWKFIRKEVEKEASPKLFVISAILGIVGIMSGTILLTAKLWMKKQPEDDTMPEGTALSARVSAPPKVAKGTQRATPKLDRAQALKIASDGVTLKGRMFNYQNGKNDLTVSHMVSGIFNNQCMVRNETRSTMVMNALFINCSTFLMIAHGELIIDDEDLIGFYFNKGRVLEGLVVKWKEMNKVKVFDFDLKEETDLYLISLPPKFYIPGVKTIEDKFLVREDFKDVNGFRGVLTTFTKEGNQLVATAWGMDNVSLEAKRQRYVVEKDGQEFEFSSAVNLRYNYGGKAGDCTSPLMLVRHEWSHGRRIAGVHKAGHDSYAAGLSEPVSQEQLRHALDRLATFGVTFRYTGQMSMFYPGPISVNGEPVEAYSADLCEYKDFIPGHCNENSHIIPSAIQNMKIDELPVSKDVARLKPFVNEDGQLVDPRANALKKFAVPITIVDEDILDICVQDYKNVLSAIRERREPRVLTLDEAVFGIPGEKYITSLSVKTSPGWYWKKSIGGRGKQKLINLDKGYVHPMLRSAVIERIENAKNGIIQEAIFEDHLKDERRPPEKVKLGKTRLFSAGPVDLTIAMRQYFSSFCAWMMENRIYTESSVGINPTSPEWTMLANHTLKYGDYIIAGDFSNFDGTLIRQILMRIIEIINWWYGDEDDEASLVREVLWRTVIGALHLNDGRLYSVYGCNPSGNALTVFINTIYNVLFFRYVYYTSMIKLGKQPAEFPFSKYVSMNAFGDDNIVGVDPRVHEWFNPITVTEGARAINMEYTDESKNGSVTNFRSIRDVEYLKRSFVYDEKYNLYIGRMQLAVLLDAPNWTWDDILYSDLGMSCEQCIRELALHDESVFNHYSKILLAAARKACYPKMEITTWKAYRASMLFGMYDSSDTSVY